MSPGLPFVVRRSPPPLCAVVGLSNAEVQALQGLLQGLSNPLSLAPIALEALLSFEAATLSGFRLGFDVSLAGGHGECLHPVERVPLRHALAYFLLSFAGHLRYIWALTASAIRAPSSARLMHGQREGWP
jgi:hypothetical protein